MSDLEQLAIKLKKVGFIINCHDLDRLLDGAAAASVDSREWIASLGVAVAQSPVAEELSLVLNQRCAQLHDGLSASPEMRSSRLIALRAALKESNLDWFLLPCTDEYLGEEIPRCAMRLRWLTGFSGSAGLAVLGKEKAYLFVDGRYVEQARIETNPEDIEIISTVIESPKTCLERLLRRGERVGFDPWLHSIADAESFKKCCKRAYAEWIHIDSNPVDQLWSDRPPPPLTPIHRLNDHSAGCSSAEKRANIAKALAECRCHATVLTTPSSIAWLLNIRACDLPYTPVALAYVILDVHDHVDVFLDQPTARGFNDLTVVLHPRGEFLSAIKAVGQGGKRILLDHHRTPAAIAHYLEEAGADIFLDHDPCLLSRSVKNKAEILGSREAHRRDGIAMIRFLAWLETEALSGKISESSAAQTLETLRRQDPHFRRPSFATISAAGPNSARAHYRFDEESDHPIRPSMLYLIDSGGHYDNATTDVTRTVAIGLPSIEQQDRHARVIKGLIALSQLHFPSGTRGSQIDIIARMALWQAGLDYDHGTGHGVGAGIEVHEGPQRIAKVGGDAVLKPGMILSVEPAYYRSGFYGIRQENLVIIVKVNSPQGAERDLLGFETLTRVPFDQKLMAPDKLSPSDIVWLDKYHHRVWSEIAPCLDSSADIAVCAWLKRATAPLAKPTVGEPKLGEKL